MSTNPESAAVEAVAWRYWSATHPSHVNVLGPGQYEYMDAGKWHPDHAEPLYPQSALDALRGEVERLGEQLRYVSEASCHETTRADAAERRVAELRQALLSVEAALGPNVHLYDTTSDMARALEVATATLTKESP